MIFHVFDESVTDGQTDGRTDGRTDKPGYRDARTHLKMYVQKKPAIAHFKGPVDFMPYREKCRIDNI